MGKGCLRNCIACCNLVPLFFVCLMIAWSYYAYVVELCIMYVPETYLQVILLFFYHLLFIPFVFSYLGTVCAKRLGVPPDFHLDTEEFTIVREAVARNDHEAVQDVLKKRVERRGLPLVTRTPKGDIRFCMACAHIKPDRAHHCSACDRCVLRMDHHCVWTGTCIGFHNHKQFFLFLVYTLVYASYLIGTTVPYTAAFLAGLAPPGSMDSPSATPTYRTGGDLTTRPARVNLVLLPVISMAIALGVGLLAGHQIWLISNNKTGLEGLQKPVLANGRTCDLLFKVDSYRYNWRALFGPRVALWFVPIFSSRLDGVTYPTRLDEPSGRSYRQLRDSEDVAITIT